MEAGRLYRLLRQLRAVSAAAAGSGAANATRPGGMSPCAIAIIEDLAGHPSSSITEIVGRTGLVQSVVSTAVAQLRSDGLLRTAPDPRDRRRTLVTPVPDLPARHERTVQEALRRLRPELDAAGRAELVQHLERIEALLAR